MMNAYQAPGVVDHDRVDVCHYPGQAAYSCHLCRGHCADLGGLYGANDSDPKSPAANFDFVVVVVVEEEERMGLGTPLEARSPMSMGLAGMRLKEAEEDLGEPLAGGPVVDLGEQNWDRLADS